MEPGGGGGPKAAGTEEMLSRDVSQQVYEDLLIHLSASFFGEGTSSSMKPEIRPTFRVGVDQQQVSLSKTPRRRGEHFFIPEITKKRRTQVQEESQVQIKLQVKLPVHPLMTSCDSSPA